MFSATAVMEEASVRSIELIQSVLNVLAGVGMNDVEHHEQSVLVRGVNHVLEVVGRTESRRSRKEAGDLVTKGGVVGVLHYGHNLDGVVALANNSRNHVVSEVSVAADLIFLGCDTNVALVDPQGTRRLGTLALEVIFLVTGRMPNVLLVVRSLAGFLRWLLYVFCPRRQTVHQLTALCADDDFDLREMIYRARSVFPRRQEQLPLAERQLLELIRLPLPSVEVTGQVNCLSRRRPFSDDNGVVALNVNAEVFVALGEVFESTF